MQVLARHNDYRCMHNAEPMTWNVDLEANAKQWVVVGHGQRSPIYKLENIGGFALVGENMANDVTDEGGARSVAGAVQLWYDQVWNTEGGKGRVDDYSYDWAKYTQVVWKSSTSLGCALYNSVLVCDYGPAGNEAGKFLSEVNPTARTENECRR